MPSTDRTSLLKTLLIALGSYGLFLILSVAGAVYYVGNNLKALNQSMIELERLSQDVTVIHDFFLEQAKDRKNVLLRGQEQSDLDDYWGQIGTSTAQINTYLDIVLKNPLSAPYHAELETFRGEHARLIETYRQGLVILKETGDPIASDRHVRGEGRQVGAILTQVLEKIRADRQQQFLEKEQQIQMVLLVSALGLILAIAIFSSLLAIVMSSPILRIVRFTKLLEESRQSIRENDPESLIENKPTKDAQNDEISYMIDTYCQLADVIGDYSQQLQAREAAQRTTLIDERNRLAREIHDTLAQAFTGISLQLEAARSRLDLPAQIAPSPEAPSPEPPSPNAQTPAPQSPAAPFIRRARDLARQGLSETRRSVRALRSEALETGTLPEALRKALAETTRDTGLATQFYLEGTPVPLPDDIQLNLLRIGQEAITNALRYAQSTQLELMLIFIDNPALGIRQVQLRIMDNGIGFDPATLPEQTGFGLIGIRERVARFHGTFELLSTPGIGTTIEVVMPLNDKI